jgi:hypothetical protein
MRYRSKLQAGVISIHQFTARADQRWNPSPTLNLVEEMESEAVLGLSNDSGLCSAEHKGDYVKFRVM